MLAAPTSTEKTADAVATAVAMPAWARLVPGIEADPENAKSAKSTPGRCQSSASETIETTPAKTAPATIIGHSGSGSVATSEPRTTPAIMTKPAVDCITSRVRCTRLRP